MVSDFSEKSFEAEKDHLGRRQDVDQEHHRVAFWDGVARHADHRLTHLAALVGYGGPGNLQEILKLAMVWLH
ncbi:hypothetical protein [Burkholderia ubonensis]|uniref:hypothetical protein n=1 Tax=Burkholderia ubonensis TaxID=101571 RepID=UPI001E41CE3B|nr:hypothetical protein [Burkholderia ubonensis]